MHSLTTALHLLTGRLRREEGATAVEYGLMVALIALVIVGAVGLVGDGLFDVFDDIALTTALGGGN